MRRTVVIPFGRPLRLGSRGRDVVAVKRALARAGHGPKRLRGLTPLYGPFTVRHVKAFQRKHPGVPTGHYGPPTHDRLARHFDDYALFLYLGGGAAARETRIRRKIVAACLLGHAKRGLIHYTQTAKRMQGVRERIRPPRVPAFEDCSSFSTWVYWVAGGPDPNGRGYDGQGWTGTLCQAGRAVSLAEAKPGDLVFYGRGAPWGHVAILVTVGGARRPMVVSHGSEGGPYLLELDYRADRGQIRAYL